MRCRMNWALLTLQSLHVQSLGKMHAFYSFSLNAFLVSLGRGPGLAAGSVLLTTTTKHLPYPALRGRAELPFVIAALLHTCY